MSITHTLSLLLLITATGCTSVTGLRSASEAPPVPREQLEEHTHALLINGGSKAEANHLSHFEHLEALLEQLLARGVPEEHIDIYASDGRSEAADLRVRDTLAPDARRWLIQGTRLSNALEYRDRYIDTPWGEREVYEATRLELAKWFASARQELEAGDTVLLYVTDHGLENKDNPDNGSIVLWGEELHVDELRSMLSTLPQDVRLVTVMSQCFSGSFASALLPEDGSIPDGNMCGFFAVPKDRPAFGCYPEGRARGPLGHGYTYLDALSRSMSLDDAHRATLLYDNAPDVPLRTSDVYLERLLREHAPYGDLPAFIDALLSTLPEDAWHDIDLIADTYGLPRVRSLAELEAELEETDRLERELHELSNTWDDDADTLAGALITAFIEADPAWKEQLRDRERILELDNAERAALETELLDALDPWSLAQRPVLRRGLERSRAQHQVAKEAHWQAQTQLAAGERIRVLMWAHAGEQMLATTPERAPESTGLANLRACEQHRIGPAPKAAPPPQLPALATHAELDDAIQALTKPRLGIRFAEADDMEPGAVLVEAVAPDTAASRAGLIPGDLILGTSEERFTGMYDIKAWVLSSPLGQPLELRVLREQSETRVRFQLGPP